MDMQTLVFCCAIAVCMWVFVQLAVIGITFCLPTFAPGSMYVDVARMQIDSVERKTYLHLTTSF